MDDLTGSVCIFYMRANPPIKGIVRQSPRGPGDCWVVERGNGAMAYIQAFDWMEPVPDHREGE